MYIVILCIIFVILIGIVLFCCIRVSVDADNYMELLMEEELQECSLAMTKQNEAAKT